MRFPPHRDGARVDEHPDSPDNSMTHPPSLPLKATSSRPTTIGLLASLLVVAVASGIWKDQRGTIAEMESFSRGLDLLRIERVVGLAAGHASLQALRVGTLDAPDEAYEEAHRALIRTLADAHERLTTEDFGPAWAQDVEKLAEVGGKQLDYLTDESRTPADLNRWYWGDGSDFATVHLVDNGSPWAHSLESAHWAQETIYSGLNYVHFALSHYWVARDLEVTDPAFDLIIEAAVSAALDIAPTIPSDYSPFDNDLDTLAAQRAGGAVANEVINLRRHPHLLRIDLDTDYVMGRRQEAWFDGPREIIAFGHQVIDTLATGAERIMVATEDILSDTRQRALTNSRIAFGVALLGILFALRFFGRFLRTRLRIEDRLRRIAEVDQLTGIPNRYALFQKEGPRIADAAQAGFAVLQTDLDDFKVINDLHGHAAGDAALIAFAEACQSVIRDTDTAARLGGDEFAIVLHGLSDPAEFAEDVIQRLQQRLEEPVDLGPVAVRLRATVGIAVSDGPSTLEHLLMEADSALIEAKTTRRSRHAVFSRNQRRNLVLEAHRALEAGEIHPVVQPIVRGTDRRVVGFEVLGRWEREDGSSVPSESLIATLATIHATERWLNLMLTEVARVLPDLDGFQRRFWINVETSDLVETSEFSLVDVLCEGPVPPDRLVVEVTQQVCPSDMGVAVRRLSQLRERSVLVALDDLGADGMPLRHVADLPLDFVKLDGSLVRGAVRTETGKHLMTGMVGAAVQMGLRTVAEEIETVEEEWAMTQIGATYFQGNRYGQPMAFDDLVAWYRARNALAAERA